MPTAKKAQPATQQAIITQRIVTDTALIDINDDHSFTLQKGEYTVALTGGINATRIIDITEPTDPITVEQSGSGQLIGNINTNGDNKYLIQYLQHRQWHPIQTLPADQYAVILTLK